MGAGGAPTEERKYYRIPYKEAKELVVRGDYRYLVGRSEFEAFANFYCRQLESGELECVKLWRNDRTGGRGGAVFRGTPEEVCCWIAWDMAGTIASARVKTVLRSTFGVEVDPEKIDSAHRSMVKKVLGV